MFFINEALNLYFNNLEGGNTYSNILHGTFTVTSVPNTFESLDEFFTIIVENHITAYPAFFGVADILSDTTEMLKTVALHQVQVGALRLSRFAQAQAQVPA